MLGLVFVRADSFLGREAYSYPRCCTLKLEFRETLPALCQTDYIADVLLGGIKLTKNAAGRMQQSGEETICCPDR